MCQRWGGTVNGRFTLVLLVGGSAARPGGPSCWLLNLGGHQMPLANVAAQGWWGKHQSWNNIITGGNIATGNITK